MLLQFIKDGFQCGDKAVRVVYPEQRQDHLRRLAAVGIETPAAQQNGQFELRTNTEGYLRDGRFDQDRMSEVFDWRATTPMVDFPSATLSTAWTGWSNTGRMRTRLSSSNRVLVTSGAATTMLLRRSYAKNGA